MAISKIQQTQISGSLSFDDSLAANSDLAIQTTLRGDLDALRSQVKRIVGNSSWYEALDGGQDLADIYAVVHAEGNGAAFQGAITTVGSASIGGAFNTVGMSTLNGGIDVESGRLAVADGGAGVTMNGTLAVTGESTLNNSLTVSGLTTLNGGVNFENGLFAISDGAIYATMNSRLYVDGITQFRNTQNFIAGAYITGSSGLNVGDINDPEFHVSLDGTTVIKGYVDINRLHVTGSSGLLVSSMATLDGGVNIESGKLSVPDGGGGVTMNGTLAVTGATTLSSTLSAGASTLASATITGASTIGTTLGVTGMSTLSGGIDVESGRLAVADGGAGVTMNGTLAVTGTGLITGATTLSSSLTVVGATILKEDFTILHPTTGGTTLIFDAVTGNMSVGGQCEVNSYIATNSTITAAGMATLNGGISVESGKLAVANGGDGVTMNGTLAVTGASTLSSTLVVAGTTTLNGAAVLNAGIDVESGRLAVADGGAGVTMNGTLAVTGAASVGGNLTVTGNAQVDGDLLVRGAFTYIETENMKVKDAFIYLATGSAGTSDSGIVLSKGAGSGYDLVLGQDGGAGEVVFAKVVHNSSGDSPVDINAAQLVPAWMSSLKVGSTEGSLSGSLAVSAGGLELTSEVGKTILVSAASDLRLSSNGNGSIVFAAASQTPDASFSATTIVGMLNELRLDVDAAAAGGNTSKANYSSSDFSGNILSFAAQQTLASASHKLVDVYLNGVLMSSGRDLTAISTTSVTFDEAIVTALVAEDIITVAARG